VCAECCTYFELNKTEIEFNDQVSLLVRLKDVSAVQELGSQKRLLNSKNQLVREISERAQFLLSSMHSLIRQMKDIKGECEESQRERLLKLQLVDNIVQIFQTLSLQLLEANTYEFSESNRKKTKVLLAQNLVMPVIDVFNAQKCNIKFDLQIGYQMNQDPQVKTEKTRIQLLLINIIETIKRTSLHLKLRIKLTFKLVETDLISYRIKICATTDEHDFSTFPDLQRQKAMAKELNCDLDVATEPTPTVRLKFRF